MKDIKRIFKYIIPYKWKAIANIVFNFLSTIFALFSFTLVIPFLEILFDQTQLVTTTVPFELSVESIKHNLYYLLSDIIIENGKLNALVFTGALVCVGTFGKTLFWYLANYTMIPIRNYIVRDIRHKMFNKILSLHLGYFSEEKRGNILARMTNDVQEIDFSVMSSLTMLFRDPIKIAAYLGSMFFISYELTLFVLLVLPIAGFIIGRVGKSLRRRSQDGQQRMGKLMTIIEESVYGLSIIKAFTAERFQEKHFDNTNHGYTVVQNKIHRRQQLASPLSEMLATITIVIVMWFGGRMILQAESLAPAELISYLLIFSQVIPPAKSLSQASYNIKKGLASMDRVDEILTATNEIPDPTTPEDKPNFKHGISYVNVNFAYTDAPVLKNVNLDIGYGKTIALVGQSGSGKTTMADLLPRFYDLKQGKILIDGINIKKLKLEDLRSLVGYVNQNPILFNDTFANNIRFGNENASQQDIIAAAKIAHAHDFIMESENGYDTNIGDGGGKLSGGQRQRISIARAILKNPPIMILDEATSALDTESEKLVQQALDNLMKNRTSIVIAHRLSTIKNADEICVMNEGQIVEQGKHEALLMLDGIYTKLYNMQIK